MGYRVLSADELDFVERPHEPDEAPRWTADVTEPSGLRQSRARVWRYAPGARGRRHAERVQEETFVVLRGTLTLAVGDPPERVVVPEAGIAVVEPRTPLQLRNESDRETVVFAYGAPPEGDSSEILDSAV
jgi:quercetin dioxygenase-like cupin family protein